MGARWRGDKAVRFAQEAPAPSRPYLDFAERIYHNVMGIAAAAAPLAIRKFNNSRIGGDLPSAQPTLRPIQRCRLGRGQLGNAAGC